MPLGLVWVFDPVFSQFEKAFLSELERNAKTRAKNRTKAAALYSSFQTRLPNSHLLNPLSAPRWRIKMLGEVLRLAHYFAVLELHYANGIEGAILIGDSVFSNPKVAGSKKPPDAEIRRLARVMAAEVLQIPFAVYSFTRLRIIADNMLVVNFVLDILISRR